MSVARTEFDVVVEGKSSWIKGGSKLGVIRKLWKMRLAVKVEEAGDALNSGTI